jgi:DNA-binding NtrC family response regulator
MLNIFIYGLSGLSEQFRLRAANVDGRTFQTDPPVPLLPSALSRYHDILLIDTEVMDKSGVTPDKLCDAVAGPLIFFMVSTAFTKEYQALAAINPHVSVIDRQLDEVKVFERLVSAHRARQAADKKNFLQGNMLHPSGLEVLVTGNGRMEQVVDRIKDIGPTNSTVLLSGETGTGKEVVANIIHNISRRNRGPLMAVNCGALPDALLESELFGHEKGAFSGALFRRIGKIEYASGGTLFLDELESMPEAMQVRLLRVLQEKTLQRLGGNKEIHVDFRLVAATNTNPAELLESGRLRSDLYYRLAVFPVHIPPLRRRREDIPLLATHFFNRMKRMHRDYVKIISHRAMQLLSDAPWTGNVRELQNVIERALLLADSEEIGPELVNVPSRPLPLLLKQETTCERAFQPGITLKTYKSMQIQSAERQYLVQLLEYTGGHIGESARFAGLSPRALYNKMRTYGLRKEDYRKSELQVPIGTKTEIPLQ